MSGPLICDLEGFTITAKEQDVLREPIVGGVILFSRNYQCPAQVLELTEHIRQINPELFICVDQEGGRVQRFKEGLVRLPAPGQIQSIAPQDPARMAENLGWLMSAQIRALGLDFSFAPVLDINRGVCPIVGDRAFGEDADTVSELTMAYVRGMHQNGMPAVGKHFPGHGAVMTDSHLTTPYDRRSFDEIKEDMKPFEQLTRAGLDAVMPAHIVYEAIDSMPASLSEYWLKEVLRKQINFTGVVICDDISMSGAAENIGAPAERFTRALQAGNDFVLVCNAPNDVDTIIKSLGHQRFAGNANAASLRARGKALSLDEIATSGRAQATLKALEDALTTGD